MVFTKYINTHTYIFSMKKEKLMQKFEILKLQFFKIFHDRAQITTDEFKEFICDKANVIDFRSIANWTLLFKSKGVITQASAKQIFNVNLEALDEKEKTPQTPQKKEKERMHEGVF